MKNKQKLLLTIGGIIAVIISLGITYFLFRNFYHRPVLVDMIDNADVIGYLEWEGDLTSDVYNRLMSFDDGLVIPAVNDLETRLHCGLASCPFWGRNNAIVLRKSIDGILPEFYFYRANKTELLNTWQELSKGKETVSLFNEDYHLAIHDDLAIVSFRSLSEAPVTLVSQSISKMSWIANNPIPTWGNYIGFGYCQTECIDYLSKLTWSKVHSNFPLLSAFFHDTIRYLDFLVTPERSQLKLNYHLYFASTYVSPVISETKTVSLSAYAKDSFIVSGDKMKSKLDILASDGQNTGLWKTVMSLGLNEIMGKAWLKLLQTIRDYPYELHIRGPLPESILVIDVGTDFANFKQSLKSVLEETMPTLFPEKQSLNLPDGTQGEELVKNKNITISWISQNDDQDFKITVNDGTKILLTLSGRRQDQNVMLSLTALTSETPKYCLTSSNTQELQSIKLANPTLPLIWWDAKTVSSQEITGDIFFERKPNSC